MHDVRWWKGAALAIALTAIAACARDAKEKGAATDSTAVTADSSAAAARSLVGEAPPPEMPQSYRTISDSAFAAYVAKVRWLGAPARTGARLCTGNVQSEKCRLDIDGVRGVKALDPRTIGSNGVIVARIRNLGTEDEAFIGVPAGATRYFVMLRDSTGGAAAVILDPAHRDAGRLRRVASCDRTKDPGHVHEATSRAAFRCCGNCPVAPPQKGGVQTFMSSDTATAATTLTAPPWVTCALGCCYVEEGST